jgi:hypothetical protein
MQAGFGVLYSVQWTLPKNVEKKKRKYRIAFVSVSRLCYLYILNSTFSELFLLQKCIYVCMIRLHPLRALPLIELNVFSELVFLCCELSEYILILHLIIFFVNYYKYFLHFDMKLPKLHSMYCYLLFLREHLI